MSKFEDIKEGDISYSIDGENYLYFNFDEAALELIGELNDGEVGTVYNAEVVTHESSEYFTVDIMERLRDAAYDEVGDFSEDWLDSVTVSQENELQELLENTLDTYLISQKLSPNFFTVKNVKQIKVECIDYPNLEKSYRVI